MFFVDSTIIFKAVGAGTAGMAGTIPLFQDDNVIVESVDSICRDSADTQYMLIQGSESEGGDVRVVK